MDPYSVVSSGQASTPDSGPLTGNIAYVQVASDTSYNGVTHRISGVSGSVTLTSVGSTIAGFFIASTLDYEGLDAGPLSGLLLRPFLPGPIALLALPSGTSTALPA